MITDDERHEIGMALAAMGLDNDIMFCEDTLRLIAWDWSEGPPRQIEFKVTEFADTIELVEV